MLAFSTCWLSHRYKEGELLADEMVFHNIRTLEISHGTKVSLLPGLMKAYDEGKIQVCGVHNFCPSPVDVMIDAPDAYEFSSHRENERERAIKLTLKSIDTAVRFGGKYLVVHLGTAPIKPYSKTLETMAKNGEMHSRKWVKVKHEFIRKRREMGPLYLDRVRAALDRILPYAEEHGVKLGLESRSHYEQVPTEEEMLTIFEEYDSPFAGYWHDFGHVQRKANLGLLDHRQWLASVADRLVGCHLHDVKWPAEDHCVPFQGTIDYPQLMPFVPDELPLVWELNPRRKTADILAAWEQWQSIYGGIPATPAS
ncbi:MAG: sugar phosphate isomerase/epimerase [Verrucomicrobiales bacterium]|nr:sugar phosphate isomerase/epimerase [Verrucomicrobiales bacterium]